MNKQEEENYNSSFYYSFFLDKMIHNIRFRAFVYEGENIDEINQAILNILPEAEIEAEEAEGLLEDKIIILSGIISKKRYIKAFFKKFLELYADKLNSELEHKIDDKGNLFLRFSKKDAFNEKWTILNSGDSIHLKIKIAAYPARKEMAINKIRSAFNEN